MKRDSTHHNQFGSGMPVNGIMDFVLHFLEELLRYLCSWIVIDARCIYFKYLAVKNFFAGTNVPDPLQQFFPITATAQFL